MQGRIGHKANFQNEQKTYLILARGKIICVYEICWMTFGRETTEAGNNHALEECFFQFPTPFLIIKKNLVKWRISF
jgi:hypothetical protein